MVSTVAIQPNEIDALDQIFSANGNLLVATPIEYRRATSIPEPSLSFGLLAFGIWSVGKARSSNLKQLRTYANTIVQAPPTPQPWLCISHIFLNNREREVR